MTVIKFPIRNTSLVYVCFARSMRECYERLELTEMNLMLALVTTETVRRVDLPANMSSLSDLLAGCLNLATAVKDKVDPKPFSYHLSRQNSIFTTSEDPKRH